MTVLSVVVPTRDTRELVLRCLASVTRPDTAAVEVIVVDDGSRDGTADAVRERFRNARVVVHDRPSGFTAAANSGLAAAGGDPLLLLNSDTELEPDALDEVVGAFDRDPDLGIAGARLLYPDGTRQWSGGSAPTPGWLFAQASGIATALGRIPGYRRLRPEGGSETEGVDWVSGAAMAIRRRVWRDLGPFDPRYEFYCQDLDLCVTAGEDGWRVAVLEAFRVVHLHGGTISAADGAAGAFHPGRMWTDLVRFCAKHGGPAAARRARTALVAGARCRLLGRRLGRLAPSAGDRARRDRETAAFAAGLERVRAIDPDAAATSGHH